MVKREEQSHDQKLKIIGHFGGCKLRRRGEITPLHVATVAEQTGDVFRGL